MSLFTFFCPLKLDVLLASNFELSEGGKSRQVLSSTTSQKSTPFQTDFDSSVSQQVPTSVLTFQDTSLKDITTPKFELVSINGAQVPATPEGVLVSCICVVFEAINEAVEGHLKTPFKVVR